MISSGRGWGSQRSASSMIKEMTTSESRARKAVTGHHTGLELAVSTNSRKNQPRTNSRLNPRATTTIQTAMFTAGSFVASCETSCTRRVCVDQADCGWAWPGRWI